MRFFKKETEQAVKENIKAGLVGLSRQTTKLKIEYLDDPQPTAWGWPRYDSDTEILTVLVAPRENKK